MSPDARQLGSSDGRATVESLHADVGSRRFEALFVANLDLVESVIRYVCRQNNVNASDAEEFGAEVKLLLVKDDYDVFRKFQGRSSLRTYLTIVVHRFYLDYRNRLWGKWRPSAAARRLGPIAIRLETLVVRDRFRIREACERLLRNERVAATESELLDLAARLPLRVRRTIVGEEALDEVGTTPSGPGDEMLETERQAAVDRISKALAAAVVSLEPQERLILRLRFQQGLGVVDIAQVLRLETRPLYRRMEALLRRLREALEAAGIEGAEACDIVARNDVDISLALLADTPDTASRSHEADGV